LPFICNEDIATKVKGKVLYSDETLFNLPRGRFRYYSRLSSLEIVSDLKVKGVGSGRNRTAVAKYSMVAEWSRYLNISITNDDWLLSKPSTPDPSRGSARDNDIRVSAEELPESSTSLKPREKAYVFGIDYGIGVRVVLDVTIRGIDAEGAASFGFGELATSIVSESAEINVRYDTVGVREDILPQNAPTNITSINDLVNVQRAFYGAIDNISSDWNDAYKTTVEASEDAETGGSTGTEGTDLAGTDSSEFARTVKEDLGRKFRIEPVAYYIYRENIDAETEDSCKRDILLYRLSKKRKWQASDRKLKDRLEECIEDRTGTKATTG